MESPSLISPPISPISFSLIMGSWGQSFFRITFWEKTAMPTRAKPTIS
jgi:hypothetical protein